jgi:hypothetical protein
MQRNPVGWFEIYVQDLPRAQRFYQSVLALELSPLPLPDIGELEMMAFPMGMDSPGASGALVRMKGFTPGAGGVLVYFSCDDCATEAARVVPAGGRIHSEKFSIGQYGFIALAYDTEGNMFGLHSLK